ncbi:adenylate/guanylate cyclase domain-containing protein [Novipirellula artificiosorum]|uniref:Adenylate cyclase 1 n=1 Tax=Novipirellula artificiosorum TaxID=2528016 RepID=A0A5C6E183_9BACT|nr:adenylate/guanylate cyclase domain-containing protein [Novipirellula artificiosorum]TWU41126.1 Adenylate cyclase 1 [Novipirellula artificiosorum]
MPVAAAKPSENLPLVRWSVWQRHGLFFVCVSPVLANAIGSVINVLYNAKQIRPLLSDAQMERFDACWQGFNLLVYPVAIGCFLIPLFWLRPIHRSLLQGESVPPDRLQRARRIVINLPWWFLLVASIGWLSCIPVFPAALRAVPEPLSADVVTHLITSFIIASLIALTHSFFAVEMTIQKALFPVFFQDAIPVHVPGAVPLNITTRGVLWAFSAVVSPVVSLVLILLVPDAAHEAPAFAVAVGVVAILFGLSSSWMLGKMVATPVRLMKEAALKVARGHLDVRVDLLRADDFGLLIESFNSMVEGLRQREQLQQTFGRHVGQEAARQILSEQNSLAGREQDITVMFVDIRNFTQYASSHSPEQVVAALNVFFREAVEKIESHGGMTNKFLGDGLMALFGIGLHSDQHAQRAVKAGLEMICCMKQASEKFADVGWPDLQIGIGINSGPAIVGSIGSPKRQEYTAIGDTVNVAARVEALTKAVGCQLLITRTTRDRLTEEFVIEAEPPQRVKGKSGTLEVFRVVEQE